jgi:hypothetical protein
MNLGSLLAFLKLAQDSGITKKGKVQPVQYTITQAVDLPGITSEEAGLAWTGAGTGNEERISIRIKTGRL